MPQVGPGLGDIQLNSINYVIDMPTYRVRDITDFAPRAATPGGSIIHSELGLYQPYLKTDWRHGMGFMWETDALGYMRTDGEIDTRHAGIVMMATARTNDSDDNPAEGYSIVNDYDAADAGNDTDYTVTWGLRGLRKRTIAGVWSDEGSYGTVNIVLETNLYLHVAVDGARISRRLKSTGVATDTGVNASSTDYRWLVAHGGYIYAGKDATSEIYRDSNEDLSALAGVVGDDPNVIVIGGDLPTIGALTYLGKLFVTRQDGLFQIGDDLIARRILDFSNSVSDANFRSMAVFNNKLIFPVRDIVYQWNGSTLVDITPPFLNDRFPYETYGRFDNFVSVGRWLYMTARTNESTYEEHIIVWDGVGWHKIAEPIGAGSDTITAMGYDVHNNYLWYSVDVGSDGVTGTDTSNFIQFQDLSSFPFAAFSTSGTHSLISSRMGMGFRRVTKSTPSVIIEAENVNSTRYLVVYYSIDGGTFTEWGGSSNGRITSDGVTTLTNPLGGTNDTIEYNHLQIRIDWVTDTAAQSPVLEGFTLRFIMRPAVLSGHNFTIIAASNLKIGTSHRDLRTVRDIYSAVDTARASSAPITFLDPFGVSIQGYVSSVERRAIERHGRDERGGFPNIESRIVCNFVEVG